MEIDNSKNYIYIVKNGSVEALKSIESEQFIKQYNGAEHYKLLPLSSSIHIQNYSDDTLTDVTERNLKRIRIHALKNVLDRNFIRSPHYKTSSSLGDKLTQELSLISIPSIFYGSSIKKGSVDLSINYTGSLLCRIQDTKLNGELIETHGTNTGSIAGVVLYDEGFILLTGSWNEGVEASDIRWSTFSSASNEDVLNSASFDVNFNGTNEIHTVTMMAHAEKGDLNHSNNPTYVKYDQSDKFTSVTGKNSYFENDKVEIKNITKYNYDNYTGNLEKQTYISKIAIYDDQKNLIAIAKLAKPVRKTENRDFTFKLKLDI